MSSYWATSTGMVLLLSKDETDTLIRNYLNKTYIKNPTDNDISDFYEAISECTYLLSEQHRETTLKHLPTLDDTYAIRPDKMDVLPKHSVFMINVYESDGTVADFYPIEKPTDKTDNSLSIYDDMFVIYCNKSVLPQDILNGESYKSVDEIITEFKNKVGGYMPDDFDWKKHIGFFQNCIYC